MGKFSKYNKVRLFNIETSDFTYESMSDLYNNNGKDKVYTLRGIYINNKSKYGKAPVLATDKFFVNAPSHLLEIVEDILKDDESIELINKNKVGFKIYPYTSERFKRDCFGIEFIDM